MNAMTDSAWLDFLATRRNGGDPAALVGAASPAVRRILSRHLEGAEISRDEGRVLFESDGDDLKAIVAAADHVRRERVGDAVSFVVTRNINFTNVCYMGCRFCGFAKRRDEEGAELLSLDEVARRAEVAAQRGATEVCIQGGLHPDLIYVGYHVVWNVTPALHTPLMAVTNAISGIIIVGAMLAAGLTEGSVGRVTGTLAVALAAVNVFGGFLVTQRMLEMFRKKAPKAQRKAGGNVVEAAQ